MLNYYETVKSQQSGENKSADQPSSRSRKHTDSPQLAEKAALRKVSGYVAGIFLMFLILQYILPISISYILMVLDFPVTLHMDTLQTNTTPELSLLISMLTTVISTVFAGCFLNYLVDKPFSAASMKSKPKAGYMAVGILVFIAVGVMSAVWLDAFQERAATFNIVLHSPMVSVPGEPGEMVLFLVKATIVPALFEEFLFRGVLLGSLKKNGDSFAIVFSAVLFGLCHTNVLQMFNALLMGLVLGYFVLKGKSIWIGVAMHFVSNFISVLQSVALASFPGDQTEMVMNLINMIFLVLGICAVVYFCMQHESAFITDQVPQKSSFSKRLRVFVCTLPMLVLLAVLMVRLFNTISFAGVL